MYPTFGMIGKRAVLTAAMFIGLTQAAHAYSQPLQATITGRGGPQGRCTIAVTVDGSAEVEVSGGMGFLRTVSGRSASWRRFSCNMPLPPDPAGFNLMKTNGRGSVRLIRHPSSNAGRVLVRIDDPKAGSATYSFDLQWRAYGGGRPPVPPSLPPGLPRPVPVPGSGGFPMARTIQACKDAVTDRLTADGYRYIHFDQVAPPNNPGPNDWVTGTVTAGRGPGSAWFSFSCSADLRSGHVRAVDVRRR